jgi:hypothetical protein
LRWGRLYSRLSFRPTQPADGAGTSAHRAAKDQTGSCATAKPFGQCYVRIDGLRADVFSEALPGFLDKFLAAFTGKTLKTAANKAST